VRVRQGIIDGRRNHGADGRRHPARDFLRDEHVGQQRRMRAVLFGCARRDNHRVVSLQKRFNFGIRHFAQKDSGRLHRSDVSRSQVDKINADFGPLEVQTALA
jgi:hypothetical protein